MDYFKAAGTDYSGFKTKFVAVGNSSANPATWCLEDDNLRELFTTARDHKAQTNESSTFAVSFTWDSMNLDCWDSTDVNATNAA